MYPDRFSNPTEVFELEVVSGLGLKNKADIEAFVAIATEEMNKQRDVLKPVQTQRTPQVESTAEVQSTYQGRAEIENTMRYWIEIIGIWAGGNILTYYVMRYRGHLDEDWAWIRWIVWPLPLLISIFTLAKTVKPDTFHYNPKRDNTFRFGPSDDDE